MSELVRIADLTELEGVVIETGHDLVPINGGIHDGTNEEVIIEGTISPRDEWAQYLVSQNIITADVDLSRPIEDCRCQTPDHVAHTSTAIAKDTGKVELVAELPYPLTVRPVPSRFDPYANPAFLNDSGLHLAYMLFDAPGVNSVSLDRFSVAVQVARAIGPTIVMPDIQTSLRASGCDQLTGPPADSDTGYGNYL